MARSLRICCGYDSIRRRIIRFISVIFAPLVLRIVQHLELIRRKQRFDLLDGRLSVWLETCPDLLQLFARCLNFCRVLRFTRLPICLLSGINTGLVGYLVLLAGVGEVVLDWLQFASLLVGELQLLLETGWKEGLFAQRPVVFKRFLVFHGLGEGEANWCWCWYLAPAKPGRPVPVNY